MATAKASAPSPDVTSTKLAVQKFLLIGTMVAANSPASTRMAPANARRRMCLGAPAQRASAMPKKPLAIEGNVDNTTSGSQVPRNRSEERRVGETGDSTCYSRWEPYH